MMKIVEIKNTKQNVELDSKDLTSDIFLFGFEGGEIDLKLNITRPEDDISIFGIVIADKEKEYKINTISNHNAPGTKSRLYIKTIALDKSKFDFTGLINIEPSAQLSDAYLKNENLILSEDAKVNSSPQLEIKADDVKASHGVSIARVNQEEMLYLQSRGLSKELAKNTIIYGFLNDLLKKLDDLTYVKFNNKILEVLK